MVRIRIVSLFGQVNPQVFISGVDLRQRTLLFDMHHAMGSAESIEFVEDNISLPDCLFGKLLAQIALEVFGLVQLGI